MKIVEEAFGEGMSQSPRIGSCLQSKWKRFFIRKRSCLNPLESGHVFRERQMRRPLSLLLKSQSPRIGSCLQRRRSTMRSMPGGSLNPLESGHVFRAKSSFGRKPRDTCLNPLESGHVFRELKRCPQSRALITSQSPRIGSCLQSGTDGVDYELIDESQSPRIGSCLQRQKAKMQGQG